MKLLFNLDVIEGNRVREHPSAYLQSLSAEQQLQAVTEFLEWAEQAAQSGSDPQARAEAEVGIATAREYLGKLQGDSPRIYTGADQETNDE